MSYGWPFAFAPVQCTETRPKPSSTIARTDFCGAWLGSQNLDLSSCNSQFPCVKSVAFGGSTASATRVANVHATVIVQTRVVLAVERWLGMSEPPLILRS